MELKLILILCYLNFSQAKKDKAKQKTTKLNKRNKTVTINSRRRNDLFFESLNQDKLWSIVFLIFCLRKHLVGAWLAWKRARVERLLIESFTHQDNLHHRILWPLSSCPSNIRTYLFLRHTSVSPLKQRVNYHFKHAIFFVPLVLTLDLYSLSFRDTGKVGLSSVGLTPGYSARYETKRCHQLKCWTWDVFDGREHTVRLGHRCDGSQGFYQRRISYHVNLIND